MLSKKFLSTSNLSAQCSISFQFIVSQSLTHRLYNDCPQFTNNWFISLYSNRKLTFAHATHLLKLIKNDKISSSVNVKISPKLFYHAPRSIFIIIIMTIKKKNHQLFDRSHNYILPKFWVCHFQQLNFKTIVRRSTPRSLHYEQLHDHFNSMITTLWSTPRLYPICSSCK